MVVKILIMRKIYTLFLMAFCLISFSTSAQIVANDDAIGVQVNGYSGGIANSNVLSNDTLNGNPASLSNITLTFLSSTNPNIFLNIGNASVQVAPGTPAGNYVLNYQICDSANTNNCDQAQVFVAVSATGINAVNDTANPSTSSGGIAFTNVLANDTLNGVPVVPSQISLSMVSSTNPGVTMSGTNVVVAPGTPPGNYTLTYQICELLNPTNCDTAVVFVPVVSVSLLKEGNYIDSMLPTGYSVGDQIVYGFTITNNTNVVLTNVSITDTNATVTGSPITLNPGQSNNTAYTATHTITQADLDAGQVNNIATVTATPPSGPNITALSSDPTPCTTCNPIPNCPTCTITQLVQNPSLELLKEGTYVDSSLPEGISVGDTIVYYFVVTNTGNVTLTDVMISDPLTTVLGGPIAALQVGASDSTTFTTSYTITQADINTGQVDNIATASGNTPQGFQVTDTSSDPNPCSNCTPINPNCTTCTIVVLPVYLDLDVSSLYSDYNNDGFTNVGDVINYQYTLTNANSINTITSINVSSTNVTVSGGPLDNLAPLATDSTTFSGVYVLTQNDINNGYVTTTATANGFLLGNPVSFSSLNTLNLNLSNGIKLNAFIDYNANGIQNPGEPNVTTAQGNFYYQINNGATHTVTSPNGMLTLYEGNPANTYTFGFVINPDYATLYSVTPSSYSNITVANGSGITTYNFPLTQNPFQDLAVNFSFGTFPRPGFVYFNSIIFKNLGNQTIPSGTITFNVNNVVTISTYPPGSTPTPNGFTYDFNNLGPYEQRAINVYFQVPTIPTVSLGQLLTNSVTATTSSADINLLNNTSSLTQVIVGSYDPNDKQEHHGGRIEFDEFTAADYLTYTIRFENTGTAEAINVSVEDVLDNQLDENTIRMVAASHDYVLDRVSSNLTWRFDGINLPPSVPDTQIGHGFITFQIKPKAGFAIGDIIPNTAEIYFDFNPAIVTNTCTTEFVETLGNDNFAFANLNFFPNPVKNSLTISNNSLIDSVEITSILGQKMLSQKVNSLQTEIYLSELSNGIYFVKVASGGQEKTIKIVKE